MSPPLLVAGAGPGGLVTALALARRGIPVTVLERAPALRAVGAGLLLQINALRMLEPLGLVGPITEAGEPLERANVEDASGRPIQSMAFEPLAARYGQRGVAIHRRALSELLAARLPGSTLRFDAGVTAVAQDPAGVDVTLASGEVIRGAGLIAADGIHSTVRRAVFGDTPLRYAGYTCWRGVAPTDTGLGPGRMAERWGRGRRFGFAPLGGGLVYWFATLNTSADGVDPDDLHPFLRDTFGSFAAPVPHLVDATPRSAILRNDIVDLPVLGRWTEGRVTLLGDAAHAMTPNLGQGACQSIEDAVVLADRLAVHPTDLPAALRAYEAIRRPRAAAIVRLSERMGALSQWENPLARSLRDTLLRLSPAAATARQMDRLYGVAVPGSTDADPARV